MEEATFETSIDIQSYYILCNEDNIIEYHYFKPIFKSIRSTIDI